MKLSEIRAHRLKVEGFPKWEASRFVDAGIALRDPALMQLRKERRAGLREAKKAGIGRRAYVRQIGFQYEVQGFKRKGKYRPLEHFEDFKTIPKVAARVSKIRSERETSKGYVGRYTILKRAGFFDFEAKLLARMDDKTDNATKVKIFESKPWQAMIRNHPRYVERGIQKALVRIRREIGQKAYDRVPMRILRARAKVRLANMLKRAYEAGRSSPWDFLKQEYKPKQPPKGYQAKARTRRKASDRVRRVMTPGRRIPVVFWD